MMGTHRFIFVAALVVATFAASTASAQREGLLPGTTVQLPTFGIAIDADGVLSLKTFDDPGGKLKAEQMAAARGKLGKNVAVASKLRKVSLIRLERAIAELHAAGKPLPEEMLYLAGLQRLQYVFYFADSKDVVIAGPAEGWFVDAAQRPIGLTTGRPVLDLRDLSIALRTYPPRQRQRVFVGCTVDPNAEGLTKLREFQKTIPAAVSQNQREQVAEYVYRGQRDALGMADARVFGVPATTHFAQVLLEADCRMKHIAIGLEPPPVPMTTFLSALQSPPKNTLQRWWFVPDYDCVKMTKDQSAIELMGVGVKLLTEEKFIAADGKLSDKTREGTGPADLYVSAFNAKYAEIAARVPVFAELRNVIDLSIAAAFVRQQDLYGKLNWQATTYRDEKAIPAETRVTPKKVRCVANVVWKGNRMLAPAGGGVTIFADQALAADHVTFEKDGQLTAAQQRGIAPATLPNHWWWD